MIKKKKVKLMLKAYDANNFAKAARKRMNGLNNGAKAVD